MKYCVTLKAEAFFEFTVEADNEEEAYLKAHQEHYRLDDLTDKVSFVGPISLEGIEVEGKEQLS